MKRTLIATTLILLALFATACATTTATPDVQGRITAIDNGTVSIAAPAGEAKTVTVSRSTVMSWYNGIDASRGDLIVGQNVNVWLKSGTQNASKLVITQ